MNTILIKSPVCDRVLGFSSFCKDLAVSSPASKEIRFSSPFVKQLLIQSFMNLEGA